MRASRRFPRVGGRTCRFSPSWWWGRSQCRASSAHRLDARSTGVGAAIVSPRPATQELAAQRQTELVELRLDLVERGLAEVRASKQLGFGVRRQVANATKLEQVDDPTAANRQVEFGDRATCRIGAVRIGALFDRDGCFRSFAKIAMHQLVVGHAE